MKSSRAECRHEWTGSANSLDDVCVHCGISVREDNQIRGSIGSPEGGVVTTLEVLRREIGPCREWIEGDVPGRCNRPAEYVLWGKLIPTEGLGPRCYDCAAKHVGHSALAPRSLYALINLVTLAHEIDRERDTVEETS